MTSTVDNARERYIKQKPGYADGPGAILEVRGLPKDAQVLTISISRKDKWLTPSGWVDHPSELPVRAHRGDDQKIDLEVPRAASDHLSPGNQVAITVPGYDLSDVIVWRALTAREEVHLTEPNIYLPERSLGEPNMRWILLPIGGMALVAVIIFAAFFMIGFETQTDGSSVAGGTARPPAGALAPPPGARDTQAPAPRRQTPPVASRPRAQNDDLCTDEGVTAAAADEWSGKLFERNVETSLREGRRLMLSGDAQGARAAFAAAVCRSADAAGRAAAFLDPNVNPEAAAFGPAGRNLAIEVYQLSQRRGYSTEAARRLTALGVGE